MSEHDIYDILLNLFTQII